MATHYSAEKAARQSERRKLQNDMLRSQCRTAVRKIRTELSKQALAAEGTKEKLALLLNNAQRVLSKAAHRNVIKHGNAARKISRLSSAVHRYLSPSSTGSSR